MKEPPPKPKPVAVKELKGNVVEDETVRHQRDTLRRLFDERGMTPAEVARSAGLKRPNVIYNFLGGHSNTFSQQTLEKLSKTLQVSVAELMGIEKPICQPAPARGLTVKASVGAGDWRDTFDLPLAEQFVAPIGVDPEWARAGAYGVVVKGRGAEKIYPHNSILVVIPLESWEGTLVPNRRVILQRIRDKVEVTVRELEVNDGRAWLWPRSTDPTDPAALIPVEMPWPAATRMWRRGDDRFLIAGVVVQATIPEG